MARLGLVNVVLTSAARVACCRSDGLAAPHDGGQVRNAQNSIPQGRLGQRCRRLVRPRVLMRAHWTRRFARSYAHRIACGTSCGEQTQTRVTDCVVGRQPVATVRPELSDRDMAPLGRQWPENSGHVPPGVRGGKHSERNFEQPPASNLNVIASVGFIYTKRQCHPSSRAHAGRNPAGPGIRF
jgi:hypothetical protein